MSSRMDFEKAKRLDNIKNPESSRNINKIPVKIPPTDDQLRLIEELKAKLEEYGKDVSYLAEPEDKNIARHVLESLIRLCRKYKL